MRSFMLTNSAVIWLVILSIEMKKIERTNVLIIIDKVWWCSNSNIWYHDYILTLLLHTSCNVFPHFIRCLFANASWHKLYLDRSKVNWTFYFLRYLRVLAMLLHTVYIVYFIWIITIAETVTWTWSKGKLVNV
jgi:hypothetical protein